MHSPQTSKQLPNIKNCVDACTGGGGGGSVRVHAHMRMHIILILMDMQENEWGKEVAHALVGADTCMGCRCALGSELCMHECTHVLYVFAYMCAVHVCGYASASMCAGSCGCACICMARMGGACGDTCACRGTFAHLWGHGQAGACVGGCASLCGGCGSMCMCWGAGRMCVLAGMHMRARVRGATCVQGVCMARPDLHV